MCPGFYPHGQGLETGLQQPQIVYGLQEEVKAEIMYETFQINFL